MGWVKVGDECEYCGTLYAEPMLRCTQCGAPLTTLRENYPETYFYNDNPSPYFYSGEVSWREDK